MVVDQERLSCSHRQTDDVITGTGLAELLLTNRPTEGARQSPQVAARNNFDATGFV